MGNERFLNQIFKIVLVGIELFCLDPDCYCLNPDPYQGSV